MSIGKLFFSRLYNCSANCLTSKEERVVVFFPLCYSKLRNEIISIACYCFQCLFSLTSAAGQMFVFFPVFLWREEKHIFLFYFILILFLLWGKAAKLSMLFRCTQRKHLLCAYICIYLHIPVYLHMRTHEYVYIIFITIFMYMHVCT